MVDTYEQALGSLVVMIDGLMPGFGWILIRQFGYAEVCIKATAHIPFMIERIRQSLGWKDDYRTMIIMLIRYEHGCSGNSSTPATTPAAAG